MYPVRAGGDGGGGDGDGGGGVGVVAMVVAVAVISFRPPRTAHGRYVQLCG